MKILWQRQYDFEEDKYQFQLIDSSNDYYATLQFKPNIKLNAIHFLFRLQ